MAKSWIKINYFKKYSHCHKNRVRLLRLSVNYVGGSHLKRILKKWIAYALVRLKSNFKNVLKNGSKLFRKMSNKWLMQVVVFEPVQLIYSKDLPIWLYRCAQQVARERARDWQHKRVRSSSLQFNSATRARYELEPGNMLQMSAEYSDIRVIS